MHLLPCLKDACKANGGRHFLQHCTLSDVIIREHLKKKYGATKTVLLDYLHPVSSRNKTADSRIGRGTGNPSQAHSALCTTSFWDGVFPAEEISNLRAYANLIPSELLDTIF